MKPIIGDLMAAATEDHESVIELTRDLVTIPSRGGVDPYNPVLDRVSAWLTTRHLPVTVLKDETDATVGLSCEIAGSRPGPRWVLNACLDTAPFGDEAAWTHPPTSAVIADGWLHGRGSSDSKSGAAIFCHIAARLAAIRDQWRGTLVLLFDVDEHTGGEGYSVTPDLCTLNVDIRTTPTFDTAAAAHLLEQLVTHVDDQWPGTRPTLIQTDTTWPAYALDTDSRLRAALLDAAHTAGVDVEPKIAGPSNIGNYLAGLGIPATAGFGVDHIGLHATDERIRLDTIPTVQAIYHAAILTLTHA